MYLISSCLVGINCRYNGTSSFNPKLQKMIDEGKAVIACPEVLGGLETPREPCEIQVNAGTTLVIGKLGNDYTKEFEKGALECLKICKENQITKAILQPRSPSCGFGKIYDGSFEGNLIDGNGLTADLLSKNGIELITDIENL